MQKYAKAIVAIIGATLIAAGDLYGAASWYPILVAFITAFGVYMVPNLPE